MEGGSSAGEVRKLHVVYFLSRNGEMEQPHLIRVCHRPHREGVRLRDVKRWLSELRGKGMPDSFAWSYKRRYRTGYVWQDLADDDLITPVSDNEYVLKGSLTTTAGAAPTVSSSSSSTVFSSPSAATSAAAVHVISQLADSSRTDPRAADPFPRGNPPGDPKTPRRPPETAPAENPNRHDEVSPKPPPPVEEKVDERAVVKERRENSVPPPHHSDASTQVTTGRAAAVLSVDIPRRADAAAAGSPLPVSNGSSCEIEEDAQPEEEGGEEEKKGARAHDSCYSLLPGRRRGHSWCGGGNGGRASHAFRNLLGCVDDSALQPVEPVPRGQPGGGKVDPLLSGGSHRDAAGGGARESRGGGRSCSRTAAGEAAGEQKTAAVHGEVYKPAAEPSCSQCGKPFKPERFHAHMRSCRALRSHRKKMSTEKLPKELESHTAMLSEEASSLFLLSH